MCLAIRKEYNGCKNKSYTESSSVWYFFCPCRPQAQISFCDCSVSSWGSRSWALLFLAGSSHNLAHVCANDARDTSQTSPEFHWFRRASHKKAFLYLWSLSCSSLKTLVSFPYYWLMSMSFWLRSTNIWFSYSNWYGSIMQYSRVCNTSSEYTIDKLKTCLFNPCNRINPFFSPKNLVKQNLRDSLNPQDLQ